MIAVTSSFCIEDANGAELVVDGDCSGATYITSLGDVGTFGGTELADLLDADRICYLHIPGSCILMVSELGETLCRFSFDHGAIEQLTSIARTGLLSEGYDYCIWFDHGSGPILCYELGVCKFDGKGELAWQRPFEEIHVVPEISGEILVYHGIEGDVMISLIDGSERGSVL